eukprot:680897-Rhodomonas_salina.1
MRAKQTVGWERGKRGQTRVEQTSIAQNEQKRALGDRQGSLTPDIARVRASSLSSDPGTSRYRARSPEVPKPWLSSSSSYPTQGLAYQNLSQVWAWQKKKVSKEEPNLRGSNTAQSRPREEAEQREELTRSGHRLHDGSRGRRLGGLLREEEEDEASQTP